MSYLVFCSFEVGGLPFKMAEMLNRHGYLTYYVSVHKNAEGHDSTKFHHDNVDTEWNLTAQFEDKISSNEKIISKLKAIKKQYNIKGCLATGEKSFLLELAGIEYNYWSFGADLDQICFYKKWPDNYSVWRKLLSILLRRSYKQRRAIQEWQQNQVESINKSLAIIMAPYQIDSYLKICPNKKKLFFPHYFPQTDFNDILASKNLNKNIIRNSIGTDRFFFSSTRHFWHGDHQLFSDNKGNDVILYAFLKYLELTSDAETKLVFIAKGQDVSATVALAENLDLTHKIVWLNEMTRDKLSAYYNAAQVVFGQFGTPVLAFSALEPLTQATPCISYFWDGQSQDVPFYENSPPILNTKDPAIIADYLAQLMTNQDLYKKACHDAWLWINNNCLEYHFVKKITGIFNEAH